MRCVFLKSMGLQNKGLKVCYIYILNFDIYTNLFKNKIYVII